ncbi:MAG: spxA [Sporomusa sp.]|jgi:arsenate reductase-like glutaredoxin family protein|nr:spxA [Sporomusa sp.]
MSWWKSLVTDGIKELVERAMNIQIFGIKKCQDTRKAERYFKERKISFQFIDLTVRGLSKGELDKVRAAVGGLENLIDKTGKEYAKRNLKYLVHNVEEMLLEHPLLLKTPVVRNGPKSTVGYCPEIWESWS